MSHLKATQSGVLVLAGLIVGVTACGGEIAGQGSQHGGVDLVKVTSDDVAGLPDSQRYTIDLQTPGVAYDVDLSRGSVSHDRIGVVTPDGRDVALRDWLKELGALDREIEQPELGDSFRIVADAADMAALRLPQPQPSAGAEDLVTGEGPSRATRSLRSGETIIENGCDGLPGGSCGLFSCSCRGEDDCNRMFCGGKCGGGAFCTGSGSTAYCFCGRAAVGVRSPATRLQPRAASSRLAF